MLRMLFYSLWTQASLASTSELLTQKALAGKDEPTQKKEKARSGKKPKIEMLHDFQQSH